ncbi:unnamed protein product, partial [Mesorhabditis belari]|uniref:Uncharacterized protein n=1 Tax=Mesorhabditis belari TaxID=2138241 RepID=A0AAF3EIH5_9BILA
MAQQNSEQDPLLQQEGNPNENNQLSIQLALQQREEVNALHRAMYNLDDVHVEKTFNTNNRREWGKLLKEKSMPTNDDKYPKGFTAIELLAFREGSILPDEESNMQKRAEKILDILDKNFRREIEDRKPLTTLLHYTVRNGNSWLTETLLKKFQKSDFINAKNKSGHTPLMLACFTDSVMVREILDLHPKEYDKDENYFHLLLKRDINWIDSFFAIAEKPFHNDVDGNKRTFWLNQIRLALNTQNIHGVTPIQCFVERSLHQNLFRLRALFNGPGNSQEEGSDRGRVLDYRFRPEETLKSFKDTVNGANPYLLHKAAAVNSYEVIQFLVDQLQIIIKPGNRNLETPNLETPLHIAAKYNNDRVVKELIAKCHRKSDVPQLLQDEDNIGMTALLFAACTNAWEAAKELITAYREYCPEISDIELLFHHNKDGNDMLILASENRHPAFIKKLLEELKVTNLHYPTVNLRESSSLSRSEKSMKKTPLHSIAKCGSLEGLKVLLSKNPILIKMLDHKNRSVLHVAAKSGHSALVEYLLDREDASLILDEKNARGDTALHLAARGVCNQLLKRGAKTKDCTNADRMTAFDLAISHGRLECVKVLVKHYNINGDSNDRMAPLHYAAKEGYESIVSYLLANGAKLDQDFLDPPIPLGKTALDVALDHQKIRVAEILLEDKRDDWKSLLRRCVYKPNNGELVTPMRRLIKEFPSLAKQVMTQCIKPTTHEGDRHSYDFEFIDDTFMLPNNDSKDINDNSKDIKPLNSTDEGYRLSNGTEEELIQPDGHLNPKAKQYTENGSEIRENHPLKLMAKSENVETRELLKHELVKVLLDYRWNIYGYYGFYLCSLLPYVGFLISYIGLFCCTDQWYKELNRTITSNTTSSITLSVDMENWLVAWLVLISLLILFGKEGFQISKIGWNYFSHLENYVEWLVYIGASITTVWRFWELHQQNIFFDDKKVFTSEYLRGTAMILFCIFVVLIVVLLSNLYTGVAVGDIEKIQKETEINKMSVLADCVLMQGTLISTIMEKQKYKITDYHKDKNFCREACKFRKQCFYACYDWFYLWFISNVLRIHSREKKDEDQGSQQQNQRPASTSSTEQKNRSLSRRTTKFKVNQRRASTSSTEQKNPSLSRQTTKFKEENFYSNDPTQNYLATNYNMIKQLKHEMATLSKQQVKMFEVINIIKDDWVTNYNMIKELKHEMAILSKQQVEMFEVKVNINKPQGFLAVTIKDAQQQFPESSPEQPAPSQSDSWEAELPILETILTSPSILTEKISPSLIAKLKMSNSKIDLADPKTSSSSMDSSKSDVGTLKVNVIEAPADTKDEQKASKEKEQQQSSEISEQEK